MRKIFKNFNLFSCVILAFLLLVPFVLISPNHASNQIKSEAALFDGNDWVSEELEVFLNDLGGGDLSELDTMLRKDLAEDSKALAVSGFRDNITEEPNDYGEIVKVNRRLPVIPGMRLYKKKDFTIGELVCRPVYLSYDTSNNIILTMIVTKTTSGSLPSYKIDGVENKFGESFEISDNSVYAPSFYSSSYARAFLNGSGDVATSAYTTKAYTFGENVYTKFSKNSNINRYLVKPINVSWQRNENRYDFAEVSVDYINPLLRWCAYFAYNPFDDTPRMGRHNIYNEGEYVGDDLFDKYYIDQSGENGASVVKKYNAWLNDYLWLPSLTEVGPAYSQGYIMCPQFPGIWGFGDVESCNYPVNYGVCMLRSADTLYEAEITQTYNWDSWDPSMLEYVTPAFSPAFHLNLTKLSREKIVPKYDLNYYDRSSGHDEFIKNEEKISRGEEWDLPTQESSAKLQREGYKLVGWEADVNGTTYYLDEGYTVPNFGPTGTTVNLYAVWEKLRYYDVVFDGGLGATNVPGPLHIEMNSAFSIPSGCYKDGYKFNHWQGSDGNDYLVYQRASHLTDIENDVITMTAVYDETWLNHISEPSGGGNFK